jgi:tetratricopeptide (TPR) repeat protein
MGNRRTFWDYNEMGLFFYSREAYDLAISEFKLAVRAAIFPMATLHINLGAAYLGKKLYREARGSLEQGLALEPDNQKGHWLLAKTLQATGAPTEALAEFERAYDLDPNSAVGQSAHEDIVALRSSHPDSTQAPHGTPR